MPPSTTHDAVNEQLPEALSTSRSVQTAERQLDTLVDELKTLVKTSFDSGTAIHEIESNMFRKLLELGHECMNMVFRMGGAGDVGEHLDHPDHDRRLKRLPEPMTRTYRSIFGDFTLTRRVYGTRPKKKVLAIPFDEHLGLPETNFSLLLEEWVSLLAVDASWGEAVNKLERILGVHVCVDSAERIVERVAANAEHFQDNLPPVEVAVEGELLVETTDNKGIVMRHKAVIEKKPLGAPSGHRSPTPDRKQMATLSGCYSIDRYQQTPDEVLSALFRDPLPEGIVRAARPGPSQARYQASLTCMSSDGQTVLNGEVTAIGWLTEHVLQRRQPGQELININDGEVSIWDNVTCLQGDVPRVDILDVIHAIERVWKVAPILGSHDQERFARKHIGSILHGQVRQVIQRFRWLATANKDLSKAQRNTVRQVCNYFKKNVDKMRYDEYLSKGYPIATGFIEGACRHLIKDRMERSGMRWTLKGAQNMLYLRCIDAGRLWDDFTSVHRQRTLSHYKQRQNYGNQFDIAA